MMLPVVTKIPPSAAVLPANDSTTSGGVLTYAVDTGVSNGSLVFNSDGSYDYTPNANFNGTDSFTYTVTDAASGESSTQTVSPDSQSGHRPDMQLMMPPLVMKIPPSARVLPVMTAPLRVVY